MSSDSSNILNKWRKNNKRKDKCKTNDKEKEGWNWWMIAIIVFVIIIIICVFLYYTYYGSDKNSCSEDSNNSNKREVKKKEIVIDSRDGILDLQTYRERTKNNVHYSGSNTVFTRGDMDGPYRFKSEM